jgi:hypothetical protein
MRATLKQRRVACPPWRVAVPRKNISPRQIGAATDKIDIET